MQGNPTTPHDWLPYAVSGVFSLLVTLANFIWGWQAKRADARKAKVEADGQIIENINNLDGIFTKWAVVQFTSLKLKQERDQQAESIRGLERQVRDLMRETKAKERYIDELERRLGKR